MSSNIEKDILRKVHDAGFTFKASTFKEATDEDLNGLFVSLITVYDTTWKFDSAKNVKQVRRNIMKYLRLLELGHLLPSIDGLMPGQPAVLRCVSALVEKLEDKHGSRLQYHVRQACKAKPPRPKPAPNLLPEDQDKQAPSSPASNLLSTLPKTPGSAHVKLLNGHPIIPGSELRGREIPRSPPANTGITPHITRTLPAVAELPSRSPRASPRIQAKRHKTESASKSQNESRTKSPAPVPSEVGVNYLHPVLTDNTIPTGRQLGRTPPRSQSKLFQQSIDSLKDSNLKSEPVGQDYQTDKLATVLDFGEDSAEDEMTAEKRTPSVDSDEQDPMESKDLASTANESVVLPASQNESTPVALTCPENLKLTQNDLQFLQHQENIAKLKGLDKEAQHLTKQFGELSYKKDLLTAEYKEVSQDVGHIGEKIQVASQEIRQALSDQTNQSPSVLPKSTKQTLLVSVSQKMAARAARLKDKVEREKQTLEEADDTLNTTQYLQTERDSLRTAVSHTMPAQVQAVEEQLRAARKQLKDQPSESEPVDMLSSRRTKHRLRVLEERIILAKKRRAIMKQMSLR